MHELLLTSFPKEALAKFPLLAHQWPIVLNFRYDSISFFLVMSIVMLQAFPDMVFPLQMLLCCHTNGILICPSSTSYIWVDSIRL